MKTCKHTAQDVEEIDEIKNLILDCIFISMFAGCQLAPQDIKKSSVQVLTVLPSLQDAKKILTIIALPI